MSWKSLDGSKGGSNLWEQLPPLNTNISSEHWWLEIRKMKVPSTYGPPLLGKHVHFWEWTYRIKSTRVFYVLPRDGRGCDVSGPAAYRALRHRLGIEKGSPNVYCTCLSIAFTVILIINIIIWIIVALLYSVISHLHKWIYKTCKTLHSLYFYIQVNNNV